ncbi:helix-turn-helix domain-containing protein [Corynebacterium gerontici]|uniref:HTH-type transcriptional repressor of iron proteins A n=1 Tax=Corynebacterium gerontici TaxID=2079234 RepID=A0A3G6J2A2_9CORY|nr:AraC family transcriptional regulator [Corynebacterium gerontici]AZA11098.1 HTH-type transcriptional repressor of iron proteins A [Corynebacterium gerontici]
MIASERSNTLHWCVEGHATLISPDSLVPVRAGDLVLATQGCVIEGEATLLPLKTQHEIFQARRIRLGKSWNDAMVYEFSRQQLVHHELSQSIANLVRPKFSAPRLPQDPKAKTVAEYLRKHPASQKSLEKFAQEQHISARTLQRHFLQGTGLVFSEWRAACRVQAAIGLLEHRIPVQEIARRVGFQATSSLNRAFQRHTGCTPVAYVAQAATHNLTPPPVPKSTIFARSQTDVVMWMYEGSATVTTPGYCRFVTKGDTVTIPAGTDTRLDVAAGSIALPIPLAHADGCMSLELIATLAQRAVAEPLFQIALPEVREEQFSEEVPQ